MDVADNTYALIEFSHTALGHCRLITTIDFANVVSLKVLVLFAIHGEETSKWYLELYSGHSHVHPPHPSCSLTVRS